MSSSSGPSTCRRSARSRNVSESSDRSLPGPDKKNVAVSSKQFQCPSDSGNLSDVSSNSNIKRKKRRKGNVYDFSSEESKNKIKNAKHKADLNRRTRLDENFIKLKLGDKRTPVVLLTRLEDDHHSQPKLAEEEKSEDKVEERVQLPGITIPSKVDPKILKRGLIVKINKKQTESLIEVSKKHSLRHLIGASDKRLEEECSGSVVGIDLNKCTERLTEKLDYCSSNDNKCTKNPIVTNSGRRLARISVDKSHNDRLPETLIENNSRSTQSSIGELSFAESQPESSKSFVHNNRRIKRNSVDQSYKDSIDLVQSKPKSIDPVEENSKNHSEGSNKEAKKYSKNAIKDIEKSLQLVNDNSNEKCSEISGDGEEKSMLSSDREISENKSGIPNEKSKKFSKSFVEGNTRPKRNLASKSNTNHFDDLVEKSSSESLQDLQHEKLDKNIQDSKNGSENHKIVTRKTADKNSNDTESAVEKVSNSTDESVEEHSRKFSKKLDKKTECSKSETESNKSIAADSKNERCEEDLNNISVNFSENFVVAHGKKLPENLNKNVKEKIKNQTEKSRRITRNTSDATQKHVEITHETDLNCTEDTVEESHTNETQCVDKNIQKCSKNLHENNRRVKKNSNRSTEQVVEEENSSKKVDKKVKSVSESTVQISIKNKSENISKNFDEIIAKIPKVTIENNKKLGKNLIKKSNDKLHETSTENNLDSNSTENNQRPKRIIRKKSLDIYPEAESKDIPKNLEKKHLNFPIKNDKRKARKLSDKNEAYVESAVEQKVDDKQHNIEEKNKKEIEITKRVKRRTSLDKQDDPQHTTEVNKKELPKESHPYINESPKIEIKNIIITRNSLLNKSEKPSTNLKENSSDTIKNVVQESKTKLPKDLYKNVKDCSETQTENKQVTRKSSLYREEKQVENLVESNAVTDHVSTQESKEKLPKESHMNIKDCPATQTEKKTILKKTSPQKCTKHTNVQEDTINFSKESDVNIKDCSQAQSEGSIVTRNSSHKERPVNIAENNSNFTLNATQEGKEKLTKVFDVNIKDCTKTSTENKIMNKKHSMSSSSKVIKPVDEEKTKELNEESSEIIGDTSKSQTEHKMVTRNSLTDKQEKLSENYLKKSSKIVQSVADKNKEKVPEVSPKLNNENSKSQTESLKRITRKSSLDKHSRNAVLNNSDCLPSTVIEKNEAKITENQQNVTEENPKISSDVNKSSKKSSNVSQNSVKKNAEQTLEKPQSIIDECSKNQTENKKRFARKSSPDKHERNTENVITNKVNSVQSPIEENEKKLPEKQLKTEKECSKVMHENKRITRKSSPDKQAEKRAENNTENNLDNTKNSVEKSDDKLIEDPLNIQECLKNHTENHKSVETKSLPNQHEQYIESVTINISNGSENFVEKGDDRIYEEPQKMIKECFKIQTEINKRIARKSSDRNERHTENLIENDVNSMQNLIDPDNEILSERLDNKENSKSQIEINTRITRNSPLKKDRHKNLIENNVEFVQNFVEESKERGSENLVSVKVFSKGFTDNKKYRKNSVDKINETQSENAIENGVEESNEIQPECSNENSIHESRDIVESSKRSTRRLTEKSFIKPSENFIETSLDFSVEINSTVIEKTNKLISLNNVENNQRITRQSSEKLHENFMKVNSQDVQNLHSNFNEDEIQFPNINENHRNCPKGIVEFENNENSKKDTNLVDHANNLMENIEKSAEFTVDSGREKEYITESFASSKNLLVENVEVVQNVPAGKSDNRFETFFKNNENNRKCIEDSSVRCSKRIAMKAALKNECPNNGSENLITDSIEKCSSRRLNDKSNEISTTALPTDDTKVQENSIEATTKNRTEHLNESINRSIRTTENNKITTDPPVKKSINSVQSLDEDADKSLKNSIEETYSNDSRNVDASAQQSTFDNKLIKVTSDSVLEYDHNSVGSFVENPSNVEIHSAKRMTRNSTRLLEETFFSENTENDNSGIIIEETITETTIEKNLNDLDHEEEEYVDENFSKHRRKVTLMELRRKCTENLGKRQLSCIEQKQQQDSIDVLPSSLFSDDPISALESDKSSVDPSSDSCAENATESEETYLESMSDGADSDENLADRLAQLNGFKIPPMNSPDSVDSGIPSERQKRRVEKLVLRCPKTSFLEMNAGFRCKFCTASFPNNRDLKKHCKEEHRRRLVMKITKTHANKHVMHMVEPASKQQEIEEEDSSSIARTKRPLRSSDNNTDNTESTDKITEGEIKIIVKKDGSKNSHVVKEIKITPKGSESSGNGKVPPYSPATSDLSGGGNSYRMPGPSPARSDFSSGSYPSSSHSPIKIEFNVAPVKRRPGRPRKYPIFTESELIAKQHAAAVTTTTAPIPNGRINWKNHSSKDLFTPVESIIVQPDVTFDNYPDITIESMTKAAANEKSEIPSTRYKAESSTTVGNEQSEVTHTRRIESKRKRVPSSSDEPLIPDSPAETAIMREEKRPKLSSEEAEEDEEVNKDGSSVGTQSTPASPTFLKYNITKELVVRLTKIDSVPNVAEEFNANVNDSERIDDDSASKAVKYIIEERPRRKTKPKLPYDAQQQQQQPQQQQQQQQQPQQQPQQPQQQSSSLRAVRLKGKLENNNNHVKVMDKLEKCMRDALASDVEDELEADQAQPSDAAPEAATSKSSDDFASIGDIDDSLIPSLDDNQLLVSESSQLVVTPKRQTIDKTEADESQKAKLLMLMNATTPYETSPNSSVLSTVVTESPQQHELQSLPMPLPQQTQQFCILFIPDGLYSGDPSSNKEMMTPTATIVNFQPVPDNEISNKSLIYTPTTPTKISTDEHARSYTCANCTEVLDLIGRMEASLGMTEEDKSNIKCPYCSNHFQSLFYLEYHMMQEHLKCENEKQCRHSGFNSLRIPTHETASEFEIYITFALKCRSCYDIFNTVLTLNDHVMYRHRSLVRLKPSSPLPNFSLPSLAATTINSVFSTFGQKNGSRVPVLQCPSDCVCRIGIRSSDSPLQRQQMLKRCPNAMRCLEKIEPAAYEVYTCTLCKSTFLMKDEVVDHLMKMHEVSCKFPCYTCLTSFRTLQIQENHHCSETTLQDLDKLLNIAILPTNVSGKDDNSKYPEREDSSNDEYGAIKASSATTTEGSKNGLKRKNGATIAALTQYLGSSAAKRAKQGASTPTPVPTNTGKRKKKACPKCKKKFAYRKSLQDHIIYEHILKGEGNEGPKKSAIELLKLVSSGRVNDERVEELTRMLEGYTDADGMPYTSLTRVEEDEPEEWEEKVVSKEVVSEKELAQCTRCKMSFKLPVNSDNHTKHSHRHGAAKGPLCESCVNGPQTRRRTIINNGHHLDTSSDTSATQQSSPHPQVTHSYTCKKCGGAFATPLELKTHKRTVHCKPSDRMHACDICKKAFNSSRMLEKHKKNHRESVLEDTAKANEEDESSRSSQCVDERNANKDGDANESLNDKDNSSSSRRDSSDSSSAGSKEAEEEPLNCSFCEEVCSSKVSLKNHLKREHGRRASICQFCNGLLIDTSEVRHMLDYHIVPSKSNPRRTIVQGNRSGGVLLQCDEGGCMQEDVDELVRTLGKNRLQSLMVYHDFEGKCNNAIMRCPMCPELFATRESCRFHYVWIHDDNCLLCDETFRSGSSACQHKVDAHTSCASYLWCIQRLVTAIVNTLGFDANLPSHALYRMLAMRLEDEEMMANIAVRESAMIAGCSTEKTGSEEATTATERFLEEVVLSEDQLPDSSNIIEVVIGKEDSEDDLISMLNLSPNYESCEQHKLPNAGAAPPEEEEDEETVTTVAAVAASPTTPIANPAAPAMAMATSPVVENYVSSGVCKYRLDNDEEQLVLVVTDEDLVTFRDDIGSLAERISATCDSLTLEEITEMLRAYFDSVSISSGA